VSSCTGQHEASILNVRQLAVEFDTPDGPVRTVKDVTFSLAPNETLGIVGESGSGKSVTALSILRLVPSPPGRIRAGQVLFEGEDLLTLSPRRMRAIRGNRISMIFQEPMTSLNPVMSVGAQIAEVFLLHREVSNREAMELAADMLDKVGISAPRQRIAEFPHQLSGGMRQRVMIAMALACDPSILLADEPTTALDVTIQAQMVELIDTMQQASGTGIVLIAHDMGLVAEMCDRVVVMYAGQVVEEAPVTQIFSEPLHPYTRGLLDSLPRLRTQAGQQRSARLKAIPGMVPNLSHLPSGCPFRPRCPHAMAICATELPPLLEPATNRRVRCWLHGDTPPGKPFS
jgi:oligopeptide/dipeptide ABC transporter ATP-binding protein